MVFVPGSDYRLITWSRPTDRRVPLNDYFIDKYEVSNLEYKEFVNAGGYAKRELWRHPFVKDGRTIPWDEAVRTLVDRTGLPGPRAWSNQSFPEGRADYPVTDVTWYEAAAYAAFRGKQLATIFQWEKAARNGYTPPAGVAAMPWGAFYPGDPLKGRANFGSWTAADDQRGIRHERLRRLQHGGQRRRVDVQRQLRRVSRHRRRVGRSDVHLLTVRRAARLLQFRQAWVSLCAPGGREPGRSRWAAHRTRPGGASNIRLRRRPCSRRWRARIAIEKTPLDARIEQTVETPEWKREKITFTGANGARAIAYLYLPNHVPRPLQVLHYLPAGDVAAGFRSVPDSMDDRMAPFVRGGRAAFAVVVEGYIERLRPAGFVVSSVGTVEYREIVVSRVTDLRRGLDYLETRADIDKTRIGVIAPSAGSLLGLVVAALEERYRALVFIGAGFPPSYRAIHASANPINFASHIRAPKLIVQGRYDEDTPLRTTTEPFFELLSEPKRLTIYDGGHVPSVEVLMSTTRAWLDEHLGPVVR